MKIGIDIDDTVMSFFPVFTQFCNKKLGKSLSPLDFASDFFKPLGKEKTILFLERYIQEEHSPSQLVFEDFKEIFPQLNKKEFSFITSRVNANEKQREETLKFFKDTFESFKSEIYYTSDKGVKKYEFCVENKFDLMVEDNLGVARDCVNNGIKVILLDKPWNQGVLPEGIYRVKDWNEAMEVIEEIENEN